MELLDVYTPSGDLLERGVPRERVHKEALWHRTVHIWVVNPKLGVLMQKRSPLKEAHPGLWDISAAGHIASGEDLLLSAQRECEEEIGLFCTPEELIPVGEITQQYDYPAIEAFDREIVQVYVVTTTLPLSEFIAQPEEVEELAYWLIEQFCELTERRSPLLVGHWAEYEMVAPLFQAILI